MHDGTLDQQRGGLHSLGGSGETFLQVRQRLLHVSVHSRKLKQGVHSIQACLQPQSTLTRAVRWLNVEWGNIYIISELWGQPNLLVSLVNYKLCYCCYISIFLYSGKGRPLLRFKSGLCNCKGVASVGGNLMVYYVCQQHKKVEGVLFVESILFLLSFLF